jgi:hypothetical protein
MLLDDEEQVLGALRCTCSQSAPVGSAFFVNSRLAL